MTRARRIWPRPVRRAAARLLCAPLGHWWVRSLSGLVCLRCGHVVHARTLP